MKQDTRCLRFCNWEKVQLVRERLLEHGTNYVDTLDDVESSSYSNLLKEIKEIEGLCGEQSLHFFNILRIECFSCWRLRSLLTTLGTVNPVWTDSIVAEDIFCL